MSLGKNPAFKETIISDENSRIEISSETSEEFIFCHKDPEDRIVEPLNENAWQFQFDNELPQSINKTIETSKDIFHRVIQGTGILKIKLTKLQS